MIDFYFSQTAVLNTKGDVDEFNQPIFAVGKNIPCRIEYKRRMVRNSTGQEILSESTLYTDVKLQPDDVITFDGATWIVKACEPMRMLDGSVLFYEVTL